MSNSYRVIRLILYNNMNLKCSMIYVLRKDIYIENYISYLEYTQYYNLQ